jgi:hypothetical protein
MNKLGLTLLALFLVSGGCLLGQTTPKPTADQIRRLQEYRDKNQKLGEEIARDTATGRTLFGTELPGDSSGGLSNNPSDYKVGDSGPTSASFKAISKVSDTEYLLQPRYKGAEAVLLRGFDMSKVTDGVQFILPHPITVSGTYSYTAVSGEKKTVLVLERKGAKAGGATQFVGRWRIVDGAGKTSTFFTLTSSLEAKKSHAPKVTAKWEVVGNEARITWSDGWKDIIRPQKEGFAKLGFAPGTSWDDPPTNTEKAVK